MVSEVGFVTRYGRSLLLKRQLATRTRLHWQFTTFLENYCFACFVHIYCRF